MLSDKKTAVIPSDVKLSDLLFAPQLPELQYSSAEPIMFSADENGGIVCMERDSGSGVDKEALSELAPLLKENANIVKQPEYMQPAVSKVFDDGSVIVAQSNAYSGENDNFLYETMLSRVQAEYLSELNPELSAAPIPIKGKTSGYCFLLAVNPYSDNLEETLRFVSDISVKRFEALNSGREKELSCYEKLEEIYKNSEIITAADVPRLLGGGFHLSVQWGIQSPTEPRNCFAISAAC